MQAAPADGAGRHEDAEDDVVRTPKPTVDPRRWTAPRPESTHPVQCTDVRVLPVSGYGPEDVVVLADGRVVTGLDDGRILAITPDGRTHTEIADTSARPLGIELHPDGGLVVCDAYRGVLHVDLESGETSDVVTHIDGRPMMFCNNSAVAADGTIYFTDSSTKFDIGHWRGDLIEHGATGRLFRRTPDESIDLLLDGLAFANGVALAADESFVVVAETAGYSLVRFWLTGPRAGQTEPFGPALPGFPDNISTGEDGRIWVAIASPRDKTLDLLLPRAPILRSLVWRLPQRLQPQPKHLIRIQSYDPDGTLVHDLAAKHPDFGMPTGVRQVGDEVWMGSLEESAIAVLRLPSP